MRHLVLIVFLAVICFSVKGLAQSNPCQDKQLLKLEQKDSLSSSEMELYAKLKQMCEDSKKNEREMQNEENKTAVAESISTGATVYYILSAVATIVFIVWLASL